SYRFRADDDDEADATYLAALNTPITRSRNTNTRLRMLVDATLNPESKQFQLEYREAGTSDDWKPVASPFKVGLWVWDFMDTVVGDADEENILLNECLD